MTLGNVLLRLAVWALVVPATVYTLKASEEESSTREKRSSQQVNIHVPVLSMTTSFVNVTNFLRHGDHYGYSTTLEHSMPESQADAKGVHVIWMLTPFIKFIGLVSFRSSNPPRVVSKDDSITLKLDELIWDDAVTITFKVQFDPEKSLKPGRYQMVTPVQLLYYDEYTENSQGVVLSNGTYYSPLLQKVAFNVELPGCSAALGMGSRKIKDYQITASTSYAEAQPGQARETEDAWCAKPKKGDVQNQYIQVDFLIKTRVTGLGTMRRQEKEHWVSQYMLQYSNDDVTWYDYLENGHIKKFAGPQSKSDVGMIDHYLRHPIEANHIRLIPLVWEQLICLRFELYGCMIEGSPANCISPLGLESGEITDEALSHSLPESDSSKPWYIRLNLKVTSFPFGWKARKTQSPPDWLQVDFGSLRRVTRISTMGANGIASLFVASFRLEYSNDGFSWVLYREAGQPKDLNGPQSSEESKFAVLAKLAEPFVARYLRIIPNGISNTKVMRAEIYGCFGEQIPPYGGIPEYARRSFLLDPATDRFFACMYSSEKTESSCFSTEDGVEWSEVEPSIISVTSANPTLNELYGLDRSMNFHRSRDSGDTWRQITNGYLNEIQRASDVTNATSLPENLVSPVPTAELRAVSSKGVTWGVSGTGIHVMTPGSNSWSIVGSWKCCGL